MKHRFQPQMTGTQKKGGSQWHGAVVGFYMSSINPFGVVIESEREAGSCQIYPLHVLEKVDE